MPYTRLTLLEREEISLRLRAGESYRAIAQYLGRAPSTISRDVQALVSDVDEIDPGRPHDPRSFYRGVHAQNLANARKAKKAPRKRRLGEGALWEIVLGKLRRKWSPEQISAWLKKEYPMDPTMQVSHETIYLHVYLTPHGPLRKELVSLLRQKKSLERKPRSGRTPKTPKFEGVSISERPVEVESREIPGHWEADLVEGAGHSSYLGVLSERMTRACILVPLTGKTSIPVVEAFAEALSDLPAEMRLTLTYDQGSEMAAHRLFSEKTQMSVYFCDPHSPWQKGGVENLNGLIRQYFPKGCDFSAVSREEVKKAQDELNTRPRKILGWDTPHERMEALLREGVALAP